MSNLRVSPEVLSVIDILDSCQKATGDQLAYINKFIKSHEPEIESAILAGLECPKLGPFTAVKLLHMQQERLSQNYNLAIRASNKQAPLQESQVMLATLGQLFANLKEWMRVNGVQQITLDTLPDLEEHLTIQMLIINGYRPQYEVAD